MNVDWNQPHGALNKLQNKQNNTAINKTHAIRGVYAVYTLEQILQKNYMGGGEYFARDNGKSI